MAVETLPARTAPRTSLGKVLIVDDQPDVREALRLLLKGAGYSPETAATPEDALAAAAYRDQDLIVMDMNYTWDTTSGEEGLRLLDRLRAQKQDVRIIAMTGWSTVELAVEAMQRGACDFIPKPWDNRRFLSVIDKHLKTEPPERGPMDAELALARKVQRQLLPQPHFSVYGLECECASLPVREVSGDLYDFFEIDAQRMAFLIGDVCGKGIGAALLVANLQATIRGQQELVQVPSKLMERVNYLFFQSTRPEHFASLFFGVFDRSSRVVRYVNCGHPAPVLLRSHGAVELLNPNATLLGAFKNAAFRDEEISLAPGDRLILFSDGFSEAGMVETDASDWPLETIRKQGAQHRGELAGVLAATAAEMGDQTDDITVMDVRVLP